MCDYNNISVKILSMEYMKVKVKISTLGCKVNQQESEELYARFRALGFETAGRGEAADVYVINSCTVTAAADSKTRQKIRQARAENPMALVCVVGCWVTAGGGDMPEVDVTIGSADKERTADILVEELQKRIGSDGRQSATALPKGDGSYGRTRAFLKVQDGCDRFCAYCVVPYARGAVRSKPSSEVLAEAEELIESGYKEIVLTGINLALFGQGEGFRIQDVGDVALGTLVEKICGLPGEFCVRLGSLEPTVVDAETAVRIAGVKGVCPQLHLSLQGGAARTLEKMGRKYTPEDYAGILEALRGLDPLFGITTDVIVGFPGETDADFEESLDFVQRMDFARVHVFKYSKRPGTKAAEMKGQVPEEVKNKRSKRMIEAGEESAARFLVRNEGAKRQTLIFGPDKSGKYIRGLTDNGIDVRLPASSRCVTNTFFDLILEEENGWGV